MKFPELMRKYLALWMALSITLALLIGYYTPEVKVLKPAIPFLLFVMLYPMMINLRVEDIGKALGYSVAAKNHAITIGIATTAFGGTLAVLPAAVAPLIQIPTMLLYLKLSERIRKFHHPGGMPLD